MPKIVKEYPDAENMKNKFVIDEISDDDPDLQRLNELNKVKMAIKKQKATLKEKNFAAQHPGIAMLAESVKKVKPEKVVEEVPKEKVEKPEKPEKQEKQEKPKEATKKPEEDFNKALNLMRANKTSVQGVKAGLDGRWMQF